MDEEGCSSSVRERKCRITQGIDGAGTDAYQTIIEFYDQVYSFVVTGEAHEHT
jgi:hypothetical protein